MSLLYVEPDRGDEDAQVKIHDSAVLERIEMDLGRVGRVSGVGPVVETAPVKPWHIVPNCWRLFFFLCCVNGSTYCRSHLPRAGYFYTVGLRCEEHLAQEACCSALPCLYFCVISIGVFTLCLERQEAGKRMCHGSSFAIRDETLCLRCAFVTFAAHIRD